MSRRQSVAGPMDSVAPVAGTTEKPRPLVEDDAWQQSAGQKPAASG